MRIAGFVVYDKSGTSWCANNLTVAVRNHPTEHGQQSVLLFICSGSPVIIPAEDVDRVEFHANSWQHCNNCDQSVYNVVGAGIAANEKPTTSGEKHKPDSRDETIRRLNAQLDIAAEMLAGNDKGANPNKDWCPDFRTVLAAILDAKEGRGQTLTEVIAELKEMVGEKPAEGGEAG
ncbi:hypothetical protein M0R72_10590 [Candidatus Pacearchaeota archaeon]|jgi:hypothetical protein|nr:hypothetical protein [Candidatus Pacearchaeota archaeon]